jgi:hypothetical protein
MTQEYERPSSLSGHTIRTRTAHGNLFVTVNWDNGKPHEIFAALSKAGSCDYAYIATIARLLSIGLQFGIPREVLIKQLSGVSCHPYMVGGDDENASPIDAIGQVLANLPDNFVSATLQDARRGPSRDGDVLELLAA